MQLTFGTGGARCTAVRATGPYLRYRYRRSAPYHVVVHGAHPYRVCCGSQAESMILIGLSSALEQQQQRDKTWAPAVQPVRVQPFSGTGHRLGGGSSTAVAAPAEDAHSTDDKEEERKRKRDQEFPLPGSGTEGDPFNLD